MSLDPKARLVCAGTTAWGRRLVAVLLFVSLILLAPAFLFREARQAEKLVDLFNRHARVESSEISATDFPALADALSGYLSGRRESAQVSISGNGAATPAFKPHETAHLKDVKSLFQLSIKLCFHAILSMALAAGTALCLSRSGKGTALFAIGAGGQTAVLAAGAFLALLAGAVALDFNSAFTLLHRLAFSNDLWLLDPSRDVLLQLMPEPFFIEYAARAAPGYLAALVVLLAFFTGLRLMGKRLAVGET